MTLALVESVATAASPKKQIVILAEHVNAAGAISDYFLSCAAKILESSGLMKNDRRVLRKIAKEKVDFIDLKWLNSVFSSRNRPQPEAIKSMLKRLTEARILLRADDGRHQVNPNAWELKI